VTKWVIFTFFLLTSNIIFAQNLESDSTSLQRTSSEILKRKISFSHKAGKLEDVLHKLSLDQNLKFSYSHDRIQHVEVKENTYASTELASLLAELLQNKGFNYILVGRIIVIVEDKNNVNKANSTADTLRTPPDSVVIPNVNSIPSDSSATSHPDSKVTENSADKDHLYSPDLNLARLDKGERRKIQKLYKGERKWASRRKEFMTADLKDSLPDTKPDPKFHSIPVPTELSNFKYYASISLGIVKSVPRIKGGVEFKDLNYHNQIKTSIHPEVNFGIVFKYLMIGTGIGYQQLKLDEQGQSIYKKSNGIGGGAGNQPDTFNFNFSNRYSVFTLPLEILLFKKGKRLFIGAGPVFKLDFIHAEVEKDKYKEYYVALKEATYIEKNSKTAFAGSLKVKAGLSLKNNIVITTGMEYVYYVSPYFKNSIYSFYPNFIQFQLSFLYLFNKSGLRRERGAL
jgi:hypothetical protein